jgi:hypothetical protein
MSDPVTNVEIEDVLSSIRRLVSENATAAHSAPFEVKTEESSHEPVAEVPKKLVLTPALRVEDSEEAPTQPEASDHITSEDTDSDFLEFNEETGAEVLSLSSKLPRFLQRHIELDALPEALPPKQEEPKSEIEQSQLDIINQMADSLDYVSGDRLDPAPQTEASAEPAEAVEEAEEEPVAASVQEVVLEDEDEAPVEAVEETEEEPLDVPEEAAEAQEPVVSEAETAPEVTTAPAEKLRASDFASVRPWENGDQKLSEWHSVRSPASQDYDPDVAGESDYAGTEVAALDWADHEPQDERKLHLSEPEPKVEPEVEPVEVEPTPVEDVIDVAPEAMAIEEEEPQVAEVVLDEEMLRELVGEIVRQELQGPLGERITRNVRKLVRREINRAFASRSLD